MAEEIKETQPEENKDVKEGKIWAMLAYLGPLCLIPLLNKRDNKFALYHGKQGLILFIGEIAAILLALIIAIIGPFIAWIAIVIFGIYSLIGIIQALMGKYWKAPIISKWAEKITI